MGHSTLTLVIDKLATSGEVLQTVKSQSEQDRAEYGYSEHPDSWTHASTPRLNSAEVFSQNEMSRIVDNLEYHQSKAVYYIPQNEWNKFFGPKKSKVPGLTQKLTVLKEELKKMRLSAYETGLPKQITNKQEVAPIFLTCSSCKSKINLTALFKTHPHAPTECPLCGEKENFENTWRAKMYNKAYANKHKKMTQKINTLEQELKSLKETELANTKPSISVAELEKYPGLKKVVKTIIFADVHH